jgi:energy-converting hydrogenase Eha subunit C
VACLHAVVAANAVAIVDVDVAAAAAAAATEMICCIVFLVWLTAYC